MRFGGCSPTRPLWIDTVFVPDAWSAGRRVILNVSQAKVVA
jgi:hypothetical protein